MESIRNLFFFRGSRGWKAVSQILSVGGVAHVQPRLGKLRFRWSKQDIFEHWKNCRDGVSNQENPKLVGTIICSKQKPGGVFFFVLDSHQKKHNLSHRNYQKNPHRRKMAFCLRSVCAFVVLDVERKVGLVGDTSMLRWRFVGNLKLDTLLETNIAPENGWLEY